MPKKAAPTGTDADLNLASMAGLFANEDQARAFLESKRWPNGPVCPHCQSTEAYKLTPKPGSEKPVRPGVYKCKKCREQFTVRVGTIFEDSKLPISKWLMAIHLMTSSKKGVSSHQIARGTSKTPVMVLVERDGTARTMPLENITSETLKGQVEVNVAKESIVMTDELAGYMGLADGPDGFAAHETVKHGAGEYSRPGKDGVTVHTNTAESFFALLKRGHYGIFHQLSKKHLHRYCTEFGFRWNQRKVSDGERMTAAIIGAEGKRLMYRQPAGLAG
jgi:transposase-like protein